MSDADDDYKTRYCSEFYEEGGGGGFKKSFPCPQTFDDHKPKITVP